MEDVYVIKVKTKPALATLYPSERRYSASTVGGLSFVHVTFGTLGLLLGVFGKSVQGIVLFVSSIAPLVSGILAWKRWYIDRNITIFFYCCVFSAAVSISCFIAAVYDASVLSEDAIALDQTTPDDLTYNQTQYLDSMNSTLELVYSTTTLTVLDLDPDNGTVDEGKINDQLKNDLYEDETVKNRILLMVNIVVACLLEFLWSLLSLRISLKGMKNEFSEGSQAGDKDGEKKTKVATTVLSSRPDIILMNRHICCSVQSLDSLQSLNAQNVYPKLPLPESNKEFKERVDKFLTNQVHHRTVSEVT